MKSYQGSLTLEWYNKEKAIILQSPEAKKDSDIHAPRLNWVNIDSAKGDFNWKLGVTALQEALLQTYDFGEIKESLAEGAKTAEGPSIGVLRGKADSMVGICSLAAPGKGAEILTYFDFAALVEKARALKPRSIVFFTIRGIEVAEDEKPEDVEIIKVPQAIFTELEK